MSTPLISICIPTYNRAVFLRPCLQSIADQFTDEEVRQQVDVFILDNQSADNTEEVALEFITAYPNIKYIRDTQKRPIAPGIIAAAGYADGEYIWVFSDDDLQMEHALKTIIKIIEQDCPDAIISNLNTFSGSADNSIKNLLKINQDKLFTQRRDFFQYLNEKIFINIDLYTTFCSNWLLRKKIFTDYFYILSRFNGPLDVFPFQSIIFYSDIQCRIKIISEPLLSGRGGNESWGSKNKIQHAFYRLKLWKNHYKNITNLNKFFLPSDWSFNIRLKRLNDVKDILRDSISPFLIKIRLYQIIIFCYRQVKKIFQNLLKLVKK